MCVCEMILLIVKLQPALVDLPQALEQPEQVPYDQHCHTYKCCQVRHPFQRIHLGRRRKEVYGEMPFPRNLST